MSWAETMISSATRRIAVTTPPMTKASLHSTQPTSWDRYDVWLTRVEQPRDRAAQVVIASASSPTLDV